MKNASSGEKPLTGADIERSFGEASQSLDKIANFFSTPLSGQGLDREQARIFEVAHTKLSMLARHFANPSLPTVLSAEYTRAVTRRSRISSTLCLICGGLLICYICFFLMERTKLKAKLSFAEEKVTTSERAKFEAITAKAQADSKMRSAEDSAKLRIAEARASLTIVQNELAAERGKEYAACVPVGDVSVAFFKGKTGQEPGAYKPKEDKETKVGDPSVNCEKAGGGSLATSNTDGTYSVGSCQLCWPVTAKK